MRAAKIVLGFALLGCGLAMLALPGPGLLTIAGALAILAAEFQWARTALDRVKNASARAAATVRRRNDHGSQVTNADRPRAD